MIRGEYNALGYTILKTHADGTEEEIYSAGNSPHCSQTWVDADAGLGLETMQEFCTLTARMFAEETGLRLGTIARMEDSP